MRGISDLRVRLRGWRQGERGRYCLRNGRRLFIRLCKRQRGAYGQSSGRYKLLRLRLLCLRLSPCLLLLLCFASQTCYCLRFNLLLFPFRVRFRWAQFWAHFCGVHYRATVERRHAASVVWWWGHGKHYHTRARNCRRGRVARRANLANGAASVGCRGPEKLLAGVRRRSLQTVSTWQ